MAAKVSRNASLQRWQTSHGTTCLRRVAAWIEGIFQLLSANRRLTP